MEFDQEGFRKKERKDIVGIIVIIILGVVIGLGYTTLTGDDDNVVEEISEGIIELESERLLDLPPGTLKDKLDLSPGDKTV